MKKQYIIIKGVKYNINFYSDVRSYVGMTDTKKKEIIIFINQNEIDFFKTIIHELLHAYFYECGLCRFSDDEQLIEWLEFTFLDIYSDFSRIVEFIKK